LDPYDYHTLILLSANPANNFLPVEFQQIDVHYEYLVSFFSGFPGNSCLKSDKVLSFSLIKSQTLTPFSVAAETHYNLGLKQI